MENLQNKYARLDIRKYTIPEIDIILKLGNFDSFTKEVFKRLNNGDTIIKISMDLTEKEIYGNYGNYSGRGPSRGSYGEYGRGGYGNYGEYGEYGNYGRRGYDAKYRGDEELDRMAGEYGRYMENRSRYGAGEETDKSFHYMTKALEDFIKVLGEEAETPQQKQQLMQTLQNSMR